jgi:hypothetical protein
MRWREATPSSGTPNDPVLKFVSRSHQRISVVDQLNGGEIIKCETRFQNGVKLASAISLSTSLYEWATSWLRAGHFCNFR